MTRSPLFLPLNRGMDMEAGGAADLQTDVMRFMAIISLCLVAIFALVQSIPLAPAIEQESQIRIAQAKTPVVEENIEEPPQPQPRQETVLVRPEPAKMPAREEPVILQRPIPEMAKSVATVSTVEPQPAPMPTTKANQTASNRQASSKSQTGFTLRFDSDQALTRLIAQDSVGLFAIAADRSVRLSIDAGRMSFWSSPLPRKIHEMDAETVPQSVLDAYGRSNGSGSNKVKWGVSIPATMSRQLDQFLTEYEGGALVIGAGGNLRMEQ